MGGRAPQGPVLIRADGLSNGKKMIFSVGRKMSRWRQEWFTRVFLTYFLSNITQSHVSEKDFLLRITEPI